MPKEQFLGKPTTRRYSEQEKDAAVPMVRTLRAELGTDHGTVRRVARQLGYGTESTRGVGAPGRHRRGPRAGGEHVRGGSGVGAGAGEPRAAAGERDPQAGSVFLRGGARPPTQEAVAFIDAHRNELGVEPWGHLPLAGDCCVLQVAPSTHYAAKVRQPCPRAWRDAVTAPGLQQLWEENYCVYGARKLWRCAQRAGLDVGRDQVARLMRTLGIEGARRTKRVRTTRADPVAARHPDLVNRDFTATAPNRLWVTDLTYVPTWAGVAYVCFIVDAYSRMIVGWRVAGHIRTDMALDAIEMARWSRGTRLEGLRCHSDAGSQFTSLRYGERLAEIGATPSIGTLADRGHLPRAGDYDNALAETVNGYYKTELIRGPARTAPWRSVEDVELATLGWVHWHNTARLHGYLGDIPPAEFEAAAYAATGSDHTEVDIPTLEPL